MKQYSDLGKRILKHGVWVTNSRTGERCLTVLNATLTYDVGAGELPIVTTRKVPYRGGIGELIGYLQGKDNAADFRELGSNTWNSNANENKAWLANPNRKGTDDMGRVYGVQGRNWTNQFGDNLDQLKKVVRNLSEGIDDRGEIVTFWNPGEFDYGCLRPCMHTHQFSLLDGTLYLTSFQRSTDVPLGLVANMLQCYILLALVAQITGHKAGTVTHHMVNVHIYENQYELFKEQMERVPLVHNAKLWIEPMISTFEDIDCMNKDSISISEYPSHPAIKYPFTV